jgi:hypothetical protein
MLLIYNFGHECIKLGNVWLVVSSMVSVYSIRVQGDHDKLSTSAYFVCLSKNSQGNPPSPKWAFHISSIYNPTDFTNRLFPQDSVLSTTYLVPKMTPLTTMLIKKLAQSIIPPSRMQQISYHFRLTPSQLLDSSRCTIRFRLARICI